MHVAQGQGQAEPDQDIATLHLLRSAYLTLLQLQQLQQREQRQQQQQGLQQQKPWQEQQQQRKRQPAVAVGCPGPLQPGLHEYGLWAATDTRPPAHTLSPAPPYALQAPATAVPPPATPSLSEAMCALLAHMGLALGPDPSPDPDLDPGLVGAGGGPAVAAGCGAGAAVAAVAHVPTSLRAGLAACQAYQGQALEARQRLADMWLGLHTPWGTQGQGGTLGQG